MNVLNHLHCLKHIFLLADLKQTKPNKTACTEHNDSQQHLQVGDDVSDDAGSVADPGAVGRGIVGGLLLGLVLGAPRGLHRVQLPELPLSGGRLLRVGVHLTRGGGGRSGSGER